MTFEKTSDLTRRGVLRGAAVSGVVLPLLTACGAEDATPAPDGGGGGAGASVATADVPVGGGTIVKDADENVFVVTQPAEGEFKAFSGICTHQKCPVTEVAGDEIVCSCHNSRYAVADGSVVGGPAPAPLAEVSATVEGDQVVVTG
ncbi:MAG TPA: Rieske (2Fe-2S) protein [Nocardioides sp.]|nr:Rieske (2Fe-2S) protein [Nocardioides sp.]